MSTSRFAPCLGRKAGLVRGGCSGRDRLVCLPHMCAAQESGPDDPGGNARSTAVPGRSSRAHSITHCTCGSFPRIVPRTVRILAQLTSTSCAPCVAASDAVDVKDSSLSSRAPSLPLGWCAVHTPHQLKRSLSIVAGLGGPCARVGVTEEKKVGASSRIDFITAHIL